VPSQHRTKGQEGAKDLQNPHQHCMVMVQANKDHQTQSLTAGLDLGMKGAIEKIGGSLKLPNLKLSFKRRPAKKCHEMSKPA